ncbi:MAG: hypothetical protein ABR985_21510 [Methanotrichaceae archaeon]
MSGTFAEVVPTGSILPSQTMAGMAEGGCCPTEWCRSRNSRALGRLCRDHTGALHRQIAPTFVMMVPKLA